MEIPFIVADSYIPYIQYIVKFPMKLCLLLPAQITHENLLNINPEALLIRTRTRVDRHLLENTRVNFIGTATIGTDHIDTEWCQSQGIKVVSAPGSNAGGVMQYVAAAIAYYCETRQISPDTLTLGVVGVGNTGSRSVKVGQALGMKILVNDPPLAEAGLLKEHCPLPELLSQSDIVTIHVPLTQNGTYPTFNLIHSGNIHHLKPQSLLINTSRGGVVDESALLAYKAVHPGFDFILDVWENEPHLNTMVLEKALVATPHIAGYSIDGKRKASYMIFNALFEHYGQPTPVELPDVPPPSMPEISAHTVTEAILKAYPIMNDDERLRKAPQNFELLRSNYSFRHEFHHYSIQGLSDSHKEKAMLLGFKTIRSNN